MSNHNHVNNRIHARASTVLAAGCDVSADTLDAARWTSNGIKHARFANTPVGHTVLIHWLTATGRAVHVVIEASGIYSVDLTLALREADGVEVMVLNPRAAKDDRRQGYRNGSYTRQLTPRVGTLDLEVPRDREGTFQTSLFDRYQRSEKALVVALIQMVVQCVSTHRVKKITTELCGREFTRSTAPRFCEKLDEQVNSWAQRTLDGQACRPTRSCFLTHCNSRFGGKEPSAPRP